MFFRIYQSLCGEMDCLLIVSIARPQTYNSALLEDLGSVAKPG
jgi:hypothetical protein